MVAVLRRHLLGVYQMARANEVRFAEVANPPPESAAATCDGATADGGRIRNILFTMGDDTDDLYFLIQRQFESHDGGLLYIESHQQSLSGHFKIKAAHLDSNMLRLELASKPTKMVQIRFQADARRANQLRRFLRIMIPAGVLTIE